MILEKMPSWGEAVRRRNIPVLFETSATRLIVDPILGGWLAWRLKGRKAGLIGADVTHIPYMTLRECGIEVEGRRRGAVFSWVMSNYEKDGSIFVNKEGRRFVNEDVTPHSGLLKEEMFKQPDKSLTVIMDSITWEKALGEHVYSLGWSPSEAEKKGIVKSEISIRKLAKKLGIDPENLEETVAKYNSYVEAGNDPDFGSKSLLREII